MSHGHQVAWDGYLSKFYYNKKIKESALTVDDASVTATSEVCSHPVGVLDSRKYRYKFTAGPCAKIGLLISSYDKKTTEDRLS